MSAYSIQQLPINESTFAKKRLARDLKELQRESSLLSTVSALPTSNIFQWHCNLRPDDGAYAGIVFHLKLDFPSTYPHAPPTVSMCTSISHPNVFESHICLDMLKQYHTNEPYAGWTSAYSVMSILLQLQSFLFAENIPQDYGGYHLADKSEQGVQFGIMRARNFTCKIRTSDDEVVVHTHDKPWPPLPKYKRKMVNVGPENLVLPSFSSLDIACSHQALDETTKATTVVSTEQKQIVLDVPSEVYVHLFTYLHPYELLQARDVCSVWRRVVFTYNLFERSQMVCFHSKNSLDNEDCILGIGLKVKYFPDGNLKEAMSVLDLVSLQAYEEENVRTGVWDKESFDQCLPLIINNGHAKKSARTIERVVYEIMKRVPPLVSPSRYHSMGYSPYVSSHCQLRPDMILHLLSVLMNTMVVQLMKDVDRPKEQHRYTQFQGQTTTVTAIRRHASEKALEGYCAFHHMLLYFAFKYPLIQTFANEQIDSFIESEKSRHKRNTPNLGTLLVNLSLSNKGWDCLWKSLILENFDRNVRWLVQKHGSLFSVFDDRERLRKTFEGTTTSMRLLMFQVYFMSHIGRPSGSKGPPDVLMRYEKNMGRPTTAQKEELQIACKDILQVKTWKEFFTKLGVPTPSNEKLVNMLRQAVQNSKQKGYHSDRPISSSGRGNGGRGRGRGRGGRGGRSYGR